MVPIELHGSRIWTLLDSGAAFNILKSSNNTGAFKKVTLASEDQSLMLHGPIHLNIIVGEQSQDVEFYTTENLSVDCILGYPWLKEHQVTIDYSRGSVHFGVQERSTIHMRDTIPSNDRPAPHTEILEHGFPPQQEREFQQLLNRFSDIFGKYNQTGTRSTAHTIQLKDAVPIAIRPYRVSDDKKRLIEEQVGEMLRDGVITHSTSPWSSPVVVVPKKDGTMRFCVDYRRVNQVTVSEPMAMPIISEALQDLGKAKVFSSLDLKSGYWQIPMARNSKPVTAFSTPDGGHYEFNVMPFGLKNAPATFQRLMTQQVLSGYLRRFCLVYLDDIIVFSETHEKHLEHLARIFERLQQHSLVLSPEKCVFAKNSLKYLGHIIRGDTTEPTSLHLEQVIRFQRPTSKTELRSFIGLCNWVREYVPRFSELLEPLNQLLPAKKPWSWTTEADQAMERIKAVFQQPLKLHRPLAEMPFVLQTDASGIGIAAVLYQIVNEDRRIISYASARLRDVERRYHINEQECLALVWAIKRYRPLLEGRRFTVRTDSKALTWLHQFKDTKVKLLRWALLLQEFDFELEHCPGKDNELPDVLSRDPSNEVTTSDCEDCERLIPPEPPVCIVLTKPLPQEIRESQKEDQITQQLIQSLDDPTCQQRDSMTSNMVVNDGCLWRASTDKLPKRLYVPKSQRYNVLQVHHDEAGHPGERETNRAIKRRYYWERMDVDIHRHIRKCQTCTVTKPGAAVPATPIKPRRPTRPWHTISIDLMGPYPRTPTKKSHILVITDTFTKWVEAFPIGGPRASNILQIIEDNVFSRFGYAQVVLTDNGSQFTGVRWQQAMRRWGIVHQRTGRYHPRANPVERRNQEIKKGLRARLLNLPHNRWAEVLPAILRDLRCRRNDATGFSPSEALLGYPLPLPGDQNLPQPDVEAPDHPDRARRLQDIHHHALQYQRRYDGGEATERFQPGDPVMIRAHPQTATKKGIHAGFQPKWIGPYIIRELHSGRVYTVEKDGTTVRVPAYDVKPAVLPTTSEPSE